MAARAGSRPPASLRAGRLRSSTSPSKPRYGRDTVWHLGQLDILAGRENIVLPGPPGTGKLDLAMRHALNVDPNDVHAVVVSDPLSVSRGIPTDALSTTVAAVSGDRAAVLALDLGA